MFKNVEETARFLKHRGLTNAEVGILLGTGLGELVRSIEIEQSIDYDEIPGFPVSTVESHHGRLIYGRLGGKQIFAMQGRFHYYEGYSLAEVTFPVRVLKHIGVKALLISNACGAVNPLYRKGGLMLIDDHINLLPDNPLRGKNVDEQGPRFPDMSCPYHRGLNQLLTDTAAKLDIELYKGVYVAVTGPNLETRAEYRFLRTIGADVVGMSTVPEVIVANHVNLPCAAISVITDECDPDNLRPVSLAEILEVAGVAEAKLNKLVASAIEAIGSADL